MLDNLPSEIKTPDKAADSLRSVLTDTDAWRINKDWKEDGVKWTGVLENMARTMDLYLALENTYCYYGNQGHTPSQQECSGATTNRLLSEGEKGDVFAHFGEQIKSLESSPNWKIPDETGTSRYHTDPGNWPLKVQTAIGYASLTHQTVNPVTGVPPSVVQDHVDRALKANFAYSEGNRDLRHYWGYQTDDGKRFWAEGPFYFRYALRDVLPFWHAVRINGMLDYHPDFNAPDPFDHPRFTKPLDWLADLTTPEGETPPLDDGNKRSMRVSMLLRWTGAYSEADTLGQKFAWIANRQNENYGAREDLLPVEIAIPRLEGSGTAPPSSVDEGSDQQVVARHSSGGQDHYVLLNGESGAAYVRGEGHEQPDQLQLLYYVNGTSFLMDSGYDSGDFTMVKYLNP